MTWMAGTKPGHDENEGAQTSAPKIGLARLKAGAGPDIMLAAS